MDIDLRQVDWSHPAVLVRAVDAYGDETEDLNAVADGDILLTMLDGKTKLISWKRALQLRPVRVRS